MNETVRFRKAATAEGRVLDWDGERLLYQRVSGETHYLNPTAALTLSALGDQPLGVGELQRRVRRAAGVDADSDAGPGQAELKTVLERFVMLGLADLIEDA